MSPKTWRELAAFRRFRPYLALEPSPHVTTMIQGLLQAWDHLNGPGGPFIWFERSLPRKFRMNFLFIPEMEPFAVDSPEAVPKARRSAAWERLIDWKRRYPGLDLPRKVLVLRILGMLGFYRDNERFLKAAPPPRNGTWSVAESEYAFLWANNQIMFYEPALKHDYSNMFYVAERAAPGSHVRMLAVMKTMSSYAERGILNAQVAEAERLGKETLAGMRGRLPPHVLAVMEARYWRAASYPAFTAGDYAETNRRLDAAEKAAREAVAAAPPEAGVFAKDNLYSVVATRCVTDLRTKRQKVALRWLQELVVLDPLGSWARLWLGMTLFDLGEIEEAHAQLVAAYHLAPPDKDKTCRWLDKCLTRLGREAEARAWREEGERIKYPPAIRRLPKPVMLAAPAAR